MIVLALGLALRIATMALYFPAVMMSADSPRFARVDPSGLFDDFWMPAGYPAFLKVVHRISDQLWVTIGIQHLLGLAAGLLIFLAVRRLGASPGLATVAAGVAIFSGDALYLEHILMADIFMFVWTVAAIAALVRGLCPRVSPRWLVAAGVFAAAAAVSRSPGLVVIAVLVLCGLLFGGVTVRARLVGAGSVAAGAAALVGAYVVCFWIVGGAYLGLTDMSGWNLYSRVAPFAKCSEFSPPAGTGKLCERTPPGKRPGAFYYVWDSSSISRRKVQPMNPSTGAPLGDFARTVILHQPGDYLVAVGTDLLRYLEPSAGAQRGYSGQSRDLVSFGFRDMGTETMVTSALGRRYDGVKVHAPGIHTLTVYQNLFRVDRLVLLLALLAMLWGLWAARGPLRIGVLAFGGCALGLYVLPTMTVSYDFRYGIAPGILLAVAGLLGAAGGLERRRGRHAGTAGGA